MTPHFTNNISVPVSDREMKKIQDLVEEESEEEKYESTAHFVRCAIMRLLRIESREKKKWITHKLEK